MSVTPIKVPGAPRLTAQGREGSRNLGLEDDPSSGIHLAGAV